MKYVREVQAEFIAEIKDYNRAFRLWAEYLVDTEEYDRDICSVFDDDGTARPVTPEQKERSQKYAREARRHLTLACRMIWPNTINMAKRSAATWTHERLVSYLDADGPEAS